MERDIEGRQLYGIHAKYATRSVYASRCSVCTGYVANPGDAPSVILPYAPLRHGLLLEGLPLDRAVRTRQVTMLQVFVLLGAVRTTSVA